MQEVGEFISSSMCDDDTRASIVSSLAAFDVGIRHMGHLRISTEALAGHECSEDCRYVSMPPPVSYGKLQESDKILAKDGEFYFCPRSFVAHRCGPEHCDRAQRSGADETCPLTFRTWPSHDSTQLDYEERDGAVLRPNYMSQVAKRTQQREEQIASDIAFRDVLQRQELFGSVHKDEEQKRQYMELLGEFVPGAISRPLPPEPVAAAAPVVVKAADDAKKVNAEETKRRIRREAIAAEEREKLAASKKEARIKRAEQRAKEATARRATSRRGHVDKELKMVSENQKSKHISKFELQTRRIPKNVTTTKMNDPTLCNAEIDTILKKVFKIPTKQKKLEPDELKYLRERCRSLWSQIAQSPAFALCPNRFDLTNTILFVMFHGMRGRGIQSARWSCKQQSWSSSSAADIAHAATCLNIPNKLTERSDAITRMLFEAKQYDDDKKSVVGGGGEGFKKRELTAREKRMMDIRGWKVSTGETYGELVKRFAERFDNPELSMPVVHCPFMASARFAK